MTATSSEEEESEVFKNENVEEIISPVYVNLDKPAEWYKLTLSHYYYYYFYVCNL